ncbi:hypothetical protein [Nocardioides daphniae]|uniref:NYN domain-containing protein n=1 Tax=Nocardioides daphniae TaxID=402297 RepID=A0A4P7UDI2_9ACTN|nr:hypothetical protein [Nocardioides daphniae]QCC77388.1 hypothetical protein E2C04_09725 [Nocardioides daphniae]
MTDLVVVSGDHAFVELAEVARVHVLAQPGKLSRRLRLAATSVTLLPDHRVAAAQALTERAGA